MKRADFAKRSVFVLLIVCVALAGCTSLDSEVTNGSTPAANREPVPGEINSNAPAAQQGRASPGFNF